MLLSLRDRLVVSLYPTHMTIVRMGRGWRPRAEKAETVMFDPMPEQPEWRAPLEALREWLKQSGHHAGDLHCILADRFVRYTLIPWVDDVQKPAELEAFASINFEAVLGTANSDWAIKVDRSAYGDASVACAVDRRLLDSLHDIAKENTIRLSAIQPGFMSVFNRFRQRIAGDALLVVLDSGLCIVATFKNSNWHGLRALKLESANPEHELQKLVDREMLLQNLDEKATAFVYSGDALNAVGLGQRIAVLVDDALPGLSGQAQKIAIAGVY